MTIKISAAHRDALYDQLLEHLSHIEDLWLAVKAKNYHMATRMSQEYCDELHLIVDDLGWGDEQGRSIELSAPPETLQRVFRRLHDLATGERDSQKVDLAEARALEDRTRLVTEACEAVFAELRPRTPNES